MSTSSSKVVRSSPSEKQRIRRVSDGDGGFGFVRPFIFVLFVVLASAVFYDCQIHGSFKDSRTGRALNEYGVVSAYEQASVQVKAFYSTAYTWTVTNVPIYVGIVKQFSQPYTKLFSEWIAIAKRHFIESLMEIHIYLTRTIPIILQWVDERFPGAVDTISSYVTHAFNTFYKLSDKLTIHILNYLQLIGSWLQENVFTGELAVDKLQNHLFRAVDTVQAYALQAFDWVGQQLKTETK